MIAMKKGVKGNKNLTEHKSTNHKSLRIKNQKKYKTKHKNKKKVFYLGSIKNAVKTNIL